MQIKDFEPLLSLANTTNTSSSSSSSSSIVSGHLPSAAQRLVKLLADRSLSSVPKEIVISTHHHATVTGE